jgi:dolichol-phosphate mannosyltransferase
VALAERYEIIVVDDASTDATAAIASSYPCRLLGHRRQQGKGAAVRTGLGAARGRFIVVMDADNTYPADAVPRLVALSDQYDFVRGVRQYGEAHMPLVNQIGNRVFDTMLTLMCGLEGRDHLSGLYGLRREALQAMDLTADGFDLEVEIAIKARARRLRATSLPIVYGRRLGETKLHAWRDGWRILRRSLALAVHGHPHRPFAPPDFSDDVPRRETYSAGAICVRSTEEPRHQGA